MAATIQVAGPTKINFRLAGTGDYSLLGYTDNDSLPTITYSDTVHEVKTVEYGDQPAEVIVTGMTAVVSFTLVKWDQTSWESIIGQLRGSSYEATVGRTLLDPSGATYSAVGIQIMPTTTGARSFTMPHCYLSGEVNDGNFGNVERRLTATFKAVQRNGNPAIIAAAVP